MQYSAVILCSAVVPCLLRNITGLHYTNTALVCTIIFRSFSYSLSLSLSVSFSLHSSLIHPVPFLAPLTILHQNTPLHYTTRQYTTLNYTKLHCTKLHHTALRALRAETEGRQLHQVIAQLRNVRKTAKVRYTSQFTLSH